MIRDFTVSTYGKKLGEVLYLEQYYRRLIPHGPSVLQSLNHLLARKSNNSSAVASNNAAAQAFERVKESLSDVTMVFLPQFDAPSSVIAHASDSALGGVFQHFFDGGWQSIFFFSKQVSHTECWYSTLSGSSLQCTML